MTNANPRDTREETQKGSRMTGLLQDMNAGERKPTKPGGALWQLTLVRWREFIREPEAVFWTFIFPLLLAGGLGIAFRDRPPDTVRVGVVQSATSVSAPINVEVLETQNQLAVELLPTDSSATHALRTGRVALVVTSNSEGEVEYRFDPSRPDARTARTIVDETLQRAAGRQDVLTVRETKISERGSRYIDFLIPGLLGMSVMGTGIWSIVFSVVTSRTKKLLKRLAATPMSRVDYLLSFIVARFVYLIGEVAVLLGFGVLVFDIPVRGSFGTIALVCLLSGFTFNAIGLLLASRAKTIEAASGLTNLVMFPMWIFSGVFFSSTNFPDAFQPFIKLLPLTASVDALRATMLQGAPLASLGSEMAVMTGWLVLSFVVALKIFRWR
jgi:ABC-2 type transport system permease protein